MLSALFATETCYAIKENDNNKEIFCRIPFCQRIHEKLTLAFSCRGKEL